MRSLRQLVFCPSDYPDIPLPRYSDLLGGSFLLGFFDYARLRAIPAITAIKSPATPRFVPDRPRSSRGYPGLVPTDIPADPDPVPVRPGYQQRVVATLTRFRTRIWLMPSANASSIQFLKIGAASAAIPLRKSS
jgi:hypothetical protein